MIDAQSERFNFHAIIGFGKFGDIIDHVYTILLDDVPE